MLNLHEVQCQVKFAPTALAPNPANLLGLNECYRQLKALGWQSTNEVHKTARTSTFTLGSAIIHYDRTAKAWQVEVAGGILQRTGDLAAITAEAQRLGEEAKEAEISPLSPAAEIAQFLTGEFPELAGRIAAALELVETGKLDLAKYQTEWDSAGFYGFWSCSCPDAHHRSPRTRYGISCKHALGGLIQQRVSQEQRLTAYRKLTDRLEGDRARREAAQGSYSAALRPDYINRKAPHYSQHNGIGHR